MITKYTSSNVSVGYSEKPYKNCFKMLGDVVDDADLIFNDRREYKNGNTLVVRTVFERLGDETVCIPDFNTRAVYGKKLMSLK